ncbi:hypothetical protein [Aromatoleum evansii]|uniref:hypothetical protein n=1 Tax=Aromatoleum evansii TaxID=59406 RepID=UPI00145E1A9F|nr:hypothetical protein [Aromatoleum evansii]NMG31277.1 hypothetical protein [Aromatoleum evansii]
MKRYSDIEELLHEVAQGIAKIEDAYADASRDEDVKAASRPLVKSCLEHLRSCLEYTAQDIYERKIGGDKSPYFPYGADLKKFMGSVSNNLPGIDRLAPNIFELISDIQPFHCGDDWLTSLCKHTNFNKHNSLSKPVRVNSPKNVTKVGRLASISGNSTIIMRDCYVDGVPVGHGTPLVLSDQRPVREMKAELPGFIPVTREFDWVEFRFPGTTTDTLHLIKRSHSRITDFVALLRKELP